MNINLSGLETEIVNMDDIADEIQNDPSAITLNSQDGTMSVDNIPDIVKITDEVYGLVQYLDTDEAVNLVKEEKSGLLYNKIDEKFPNVPFSAVKMLTDTNESDEQKAKNIIQLLELLKSIAELKEGNGDITQSFENFREEKMEEWVYPVYGGKEGFERKISEHVEQDPQTLNRKQRRYVKKQNKKLKK